MSYLSYLSFKQHIQLDGPFSSQQLVLGILANCTFTNVCNISISGNTFIPVEQSYGYFKNINGNFLFSRGIIHPTPRANRGSGENSKLIYGFKADKKLGMKSSSQKNSPQPKIGLL